MTKVQIEMGLSLRTVIFMPGTRQKTFGNNMLYVASTDPERAITERQDYYLRCLIYRFRRQIDPKVVLKHGIDSKAPKAAQAAKIIESDPERPYTPSIFP